MPTGDQVCQVHGVATCRCTPADVATVTRQGVPVHVVSPKPGSLDHSARMIWELEDHKAKALAVRRAWEAFLEDDSAGISMTDTTTAWLNAMDELCEACGVPPTEE
jgi:hypothetical protein